MRVLADTHALVWAFTEPSRLGAKAREMLTESAVVASVASLWEMCIKAGRREALVSSPVPWWARHVAGGGVETLPIKEAHVIAIASLASVHKDPFDRIMIAQAITEQLPLVTKDAHFSQYGIRTIW